MAEGSAFTYDPETNYDQETQLQREQIEKEIALSQALVSPKEDVSCLIVEYKSDDVFLTKVKDLQKKYSTLRRTRGDGNCFFRAFAFAYFEKLLSDKEEYTRFQPLAANSLDVLIGLGFQKFAVEDFHETFMEVVDKVGKGCSEEALHDIFNEQATSDYVVVYFRLIVSGHLQQEHEFFMNFVDGGRSIKEFCNQEVEPMGRESDHLHVTALTGALKVGVRVEYLDRGEGGTVTGHVFPEDSTPKTMAHATWR